MIVSVTCNTTIDLVVSIPALKPGSTMRASEAVQSLGGKPADASYILGELGVPSLALGFAGGMTGRKVQAILERKGVTVDFVETESDTRINIVIVPQDGAPHTTITTSTMQVQPQHRDALLARYDTALDGASCVVTGGTLPPGVTPAVYTALIGRARARGVPVAFDAAQPNLHVGAEAGASVIKPNRHELGDWVGRPIRTIADAYEAGREIAARYGCALAISLDRDGALLIDGDAAWHTPPLPVEVVSAAGAGDGVLAGMAHALANRQPLYEGLRLGAACAAAVCLKLGTAECDRADIERLLPQVRLLPYPA
jgi:1-phosphofructokinase